MFTSLRTTRQQLERAFAQHHARIDFDNASLPVNLHPPRELLRFIGVLVCCTGNIFTPAASSCNRQQDYRSDGEQATHTRPRSG